MTNKTVMVFQNGNNNGEVISLATFHSIENLLDILVHKYNINGKRIFLEDGLEITDLSYVRNKDKLYVVPENEEFVHSQVAPHRCSEWISLNVGGKLFTTTKSTLTRKEPTSMLARMFAAADDENSYLFLPSNIDSSGAYLIDRSPTYFEPILNYLRNGHLVYDNGINPEGILDEAKFFGIDSLIPILEAKVNSIKLSESALGRRDVIEALIRTPYTAELRFQGVNLAGADLSKLDLRFINLKFANLQGCNLSGTNLSWCCLERADLSYTIMDGAQLLGVKSLCANLEGASMKKCNFKDPAGSRANMEGVNLKGANLEYSDMGGVNLRVATLKNANLQNCDLRAAVLAGANLENCILSGSDLHEANLRGANLKDASFELMLTPLHMSQVSNYSLN